MTKSNDNHNQLARAGEINEAVYARGPLILEAVDGVKAATAELRRKLQVPESIGHAIVGSSADPNSIVSVDSHVAIAQELSYHALNGSSEQPVEQLNLEDQARQAIDDVHEGRLAV